MSSSPRLLALSLALLSAATLACTSRSDGSPAAPAVAHERSASAAGPLRLDARPGWIAETPSSSMRKAQYRLPGAAGVADASLVVFHFGAAGGGGVEANLARWAGQFEQPDGSDSHARMRTTTREVRGRSITDVDLAGTYVAETSPGSGERVHEPDWRMLASIVPAAEGDYYVKLVGPAATVARWEESYREFVTEAVP